MPSWSEPCGCGAYDCRRCRPNAPSCAACGRINCDLHDECKTCGELVDEDELTAHGDCMKCVAAEVAEEAEVAA